MMRGIYDEVVGDGMLSPRGYGLAYAFEIASHRLLRYASPFLHLIALAREPGAARRGDGLRGHPRRCSSRCWPPPCSRGRSPRGRCASPATTSSTTASIAAGLWDRVRLGTPGAWEKAEGTR